VIVSVPQIVDGKPSVPITRLRAGMLLELARSGAPQQKIPAQPPCLTSDRPAVAFQQAADGANGEHPRELRLAA
jgi:hypothetical protein